MRQVTLGYLVRGDEVLLAMKKRGFGAGKWNGFGGKLEAGETLEQGLVREAQEELSVTPRSFRKLAVIDFEFPEVPAEDGWNQQVHVYLCDTWDGTPKESEEMAPKWFSLAALPYGELWSSDVLWLDRVVNGEPVAGSVTFAGRGERVLGFQERPATGW